MSESERTTSVEKAVTAEDILESLLPLVQEYFVGECSRGEGGLLCRLPNGQQFVLKVQEI